MTTTRTALALVLAAMVAGPAAASEYDAPVKLGLAFIFHIDEDLAEQDVFVERVPGSGEVFRPTKGERDLSLPLYAAAVSVEHTPFAPDNLGPWPKGRPLGITLGEWFAAEGRGAYACVDGEGTLQVEFRNLVPDGTYTMWNDFFA